MPDQTTGSAVVERPVAATWDYRVDTVHARHTDVLEQHLKECGSEGWELTFITSPLATEYLCVFRRAL